MMKVHTLLKLLLVPILVLGLTSCENGGGDEGVPRAFTVDPRREEGVLVTAPETGTYLFTITGGAYSFYAKVENWLSYLVAYRNRPAVFGTNPKDTSPRNPDYTLGRYSPQPTPEAAEATGIGARIRVGLNAGEYLRLLVPDSQGLFDDNRGGVVVYVEQEI